MADRRQAVWGRVAAHAAARSARVAVEDVCAVAGEADQVTGAWIAASVTGQPDLVMCVTDLVCEQLAELHLTLGEGPCTDVLASAAPVLASDLGDAEFAGRWPAFAPAARELGAEAVFGFPLMIGVIRAGVMGLYRGSAGSIHDAQLGDLLILADIASLILLDAAGSASRPGDGTSLDGQAPDLALHRAQIDQATGMLTVQLAMPAAEAFARLRAYAYAEERRLADVAADIVARRLRLHPDLPQDGAL
jgi:hypothetical protein